MADHMIAAECECERDDIVADLLHPMTCPQVLAETAAEHLAALRETVAAGFHPTEALGLVAPG